MVYSEFKEGPYLNKAELITAVAEKTELSKKDSEKAVSAVLGCIEESLAKGDKIQLVGFGTFESKPRKAREGRNPQTGETIQIPATRVPVFKAGKALKDAVANLPVE
ncbi:HU family DNA-binding protein [Desulfotomaculum defluvii]